MAKDQRDARGSSKPDRGGRRDGSTSKAKGARGQTARSEGGSHRLARFGREMREVIGLYLLSGFRGELPGIVTVSRVQMSGDLRQARVLVTLMPPPGAEAFAEESKEFALAKKTAVRELQEYAHDFQTEVNRKLRLRFVPKMTFVYDEGFERAMKVEGLLRDLRVGTDQANQQDEQYESESGDVLEAEIDEEADS